MDREEAIIAFGRTDIGKVIVNNIYDDVESRTCENCKYFNNIYGEGYGDEWVSCDMVYIEISSGFNVSMFGCNEFEWSKYDNNNKQ